jgi:RNA polymerase sigma-70 factor (ECF subfamily)
MPPEPGETVGREAMLALWEEGGFGTTMDLRCVVTRANHQPAIAVYNKGEAMALDVIRIEEGKIAEIVVFSADVFADFGLPPTLE